MLPLLVLLLAPVQDLPGPPDPPAGLLFGRLHHPGPVLHLCWSPDGKTILTAGRWDAPLRAWDAETGREKGFLPGTIGAGAVTYSPDGRRIAYERTQRFTLRDVDSGREVFRGPLTNGMVHRIAYSPDGKSVLSGGTDSMVVLRDAATGRERFRWEEPAETVYSVAFSPDGKRFAMGGAHGTVRIWDAEKPAEGRKLHDRGESDVVEVAFTPDSRFLCAIGKQIPIVLWDVAGGTERRIDRLIGEPCSLALSPDGRQIALGMNTGLFAVYDLDSGNKTWSREGSLLISAVAFSPNGKILAAGDQRGGLYLCDAATGKDVIDAEGHQRGVTSLSRSADGRTLVSTGEDRSIRVWDVESRQETKVFLLEGDEHELCSAEPFGDNAVVALDNSGRLHHWDLRTGESKVLLRECQTFSVTPDGKLLAMKGAADPVLLLEAGPAPKRSWLETVGSEQSTIALSPGGDRLAILDESGKRLEYWDIPGNRRLWSVDGGKEDAGGPGRELLVSPAGDVVAWGGSGNEIQLRASADGRLLSTVKFSGDGGVEARFSFSPDGRLVASGNGNGEMEFIEVLSGQAACRVKLRPEGRSIAVFVGTDLISAGGDGDILRTPLPTGPAEGTPDPEALWAALQGDAAAAWAGMDGLLRRRAAAIPMLLEKLRADADAAELGRLVDALDDDAAEKREKALRELERIAPQADAGLRTAFAGSKSPEVRARLSTLVAALDAPLVRHPVLLQRLRAVAVLERAGAREDLERLAGPRPSTRIEREAARAAERLRR